MGAVTTPPASTGKVTLPLVADFFRGKNVFITGGSGYLGRALIFKLLRSCPDLGAIYVLLRPKRGKSAQERIAVFDEDPAFQVLQKQQPEALAKLKIVAGEMDSLKLGLSAEDQAMLKERVSIVFHVAATIRFNEPYRKAVLLNVRGTREVCELAREMQNLEAFVHVSTAYSNADIRANEERLYSPPADWRTHITLVENDAQHIMDVLSPKFLGGFPNTYVFTKNLAESVVDYYKCDLPAAIIRPSVVINGIEEPLPGWADNLNGAWGLMVGTTAGVVHGMPDTSGVDVVPVDFWAKGTILLAMKRSISGKAEEVLVCNASSHEYPALRMDLLLEHFYLYPMYDLFRPYKAFVIKIPKFFIFALVFVFVSVPVAAFWDTVSYLLTRKTGRLLRMHRTIFVGVFKILFFSEHQFYLPNNKFMALREEMNPGDKERFYWSFESIMDSPYIILGFTYFFKNILNKKQRRYPWQDLILELLHIVLCSCIFFVSWKLDVIKEVFCILVRATRMILAV